MKKTRFSILTGALLLGVVGVFATKPAKKFTEVTSGKFAGVAYALSSVSGLPSGTYTTVHGSLKTVVLATIGGSKIATLLTVGGANRIFKK